MTAADLDELRRLCAERRIVPVMLSRAQVTASYADFCNGVLWPSSTT